jgi:hypothetical protein
VAVGPEAWVVCLGLWTEYLALSKDVYDASDINITGVEARYGGAGEDCLLGGAWDTPLRKIDFHSGTLNYRRTCCEGRVGDANNSGDDEPTIADVSHLIDALFMSYDYSMIECLTEADLNQSGGEIPGPAEITIGDVTYLIDDLFITGTSLGLPDCL